MEKAVLPLWRKVTSQFICFIHLFCIVFLITGALWPRSFLIFHLVATPLVILQWVLNKNQCVLTQIQHRIEGRELNNEQDGQFVRELFGKIGLSPSEKWLRMVVYVPLVLNWLVALYRMESNSGGFFFVL